MCHTKIFWCRYVIYKKACKSKIYWFSGCKWVTSNIFLKKVLGSFQVFSDCIHSSSLFGLCQIEAALRPWGSTKYILPLKVVVYVWTKCDAYKRCRVVLVSILSFTNCTVLHTLKSLWSVPSLSPCDFLLRPTAMRKKACLRHSSSL